MIIDWEHHYLPEELWLKKGGKKGKEQKIHLPQNQAQKPSYSLFYL